MAFAQSGMTLLSPAYPKLWLYQSTDANATVVASGYFDDAERLSEGDIVICVLSTSGTVETTTLFITATGVVTSSDNITYT